MPIRAPLPAEGAKQREYMGCFKEELGASKSPDGEAQSLEQCQARAPPGQIYIAMAAPEVRQEGYAMCVPLERLPRQRVEDGECGGGPPVDGQRLGAAGRLAVYALPGRYCYQLGKRWEPLDMEGQGRSLEPSQVNCQVRCARTPRCRHFTFYPDGGCHLQDAAAVERGDGDRTVSGEPHCQVALADDRSSAQAENCTDIGYKWEPLDMDGTEGARTAREDECQGLCKSTAGCAHFTWWSDGSCRLQDRFAQQFEDDGAVSGPPSCQA